MFTDHRPKRDGGRNVREFDRDSGDFRVNVDISYFNDNLNIEDFIDSIAYINKFFNYIGVPEENRVRLVACRLKVGASAWWERLQNRRICEGKQLIRTWYRIKQLFKKDFLPLGYEQILFQQYQRCHQGMRLVYEYNAEFMWLAEQNDLRESKG